MYQNNLNLNLNFLFAFEIFEFLFCGRKVFLCFSLECSVGLRSSDMVHSSWESSRRVGTFGWKEKYEQCFLGKLLGCHSSIHSVLHTWPNQPPFIHNLTIDDTCTPHTYKCQHQLLHNCTHLPTDSVRWWYINGIRWYSVQTIIMVTIKQQHSTFPEEFSIDR